MMAAGPVPRPPPTDPATAVVGARLRCLRKARGISLQALSGSTGASIGYLSQVERGLSTPTLKLLASAADALGVSLAAFIGATGPGTRSETPVMRAGGRSGLGLWRTGISKELVAPDGGGLSMFLVRVAPDGSSGEEDYSHAGEEAGYVLEGELDLWVEGRVWRLHPGDGFRFESRRGHRFRNPGTTPALVLWVNAVAER